MTSISDQLRELFQQPFNSEKYKDVLRTLFKVKELRTIPEEITNDENEARGWFLGKMTTTDGRQIGLFQFTVYTTTLTRKRVGLRRFVRQYIHKDYGLFDAALVVFATEQGLWRLSLVCDIRGEATAPKRFTFLFGESDNRYNTAVTRLSTLRERPLSWDNLREAFSVEALSKEFYKRLYQWYEWALSPAMHISFPDLRADRTTTENINIKLIRLITRLLFVWFIKQKGLVPATLFDISSLSTILKDFAPLSADDGNYYNAILQNLFFATLNTPLRDDEGNSPRTFATATRARDTKNKYRYAEMFTGTEDEVLALFGGIPFLNGGLFDCLDRPHEHTGDSADRLCDGFSRNGRRDENGYLYRAFIPNILFFAGDDTLSSDDEKHTGLLTLLSEYNFTIEENSTDDADISLDPELLGRVFENLLASYNPETQKSERQATGSFYTPRVVVDYMVDEALTAYLRRQVPLPVGDDDPLVPLFRDNDASALDKEEQRRALANALRAVQILDPACGSGAFPMGCLLKIVDLLDALEGPVASRYSRKLAIIEHCIFGVDIQSIAMMICKLRFFISLICEQEEIDLSSPSTNFNVHTLPNLETKFVAADTLLSPVKIDSWLFNEEIEVLRKKLMAVRHDYFTARNPRQKRACRDKDKTIRAEIEGCLREQGQHIDDKQIASLRDTLAALQEERRQIAAEELLTQQRVTTQKDLFGEKSTRLVEDRRGAQINDIDERIKRCKKEIKALANRPLTTAEELAAQQITQWDPYDQNTVSTFFNAEWMFLVEGGFDIVIGNPPYIKLQNNQGAVGAPYQNAGYATFVKTGDIYCLFYERGLKLLTAGGVLCLITSNKWLRAGYGEKLRGYLAKESNPRLLVDFAGTHIFENATVDTNILLATKGKNEGATRCTTFGGRRLSTSENIAATVAATSTLNAFRGSSAWVLLTAEEQALKAKIEKVGTPLSKWGISIKRGVLTGCNEAFLITSAKREALLAACHDAAERQRTDSLLRPLLRGRDIKRYGYQWADLYLIYLPWHFPYQFDDTITGASPRAEAAFKEQYPVVYEHMLAYKDKLSRRNQAETGIRYEWYALQRWGANYWREFAKPKIVYQELTQGSTFAFDSDGTYYVANTAYLITGDSVGYLLHYLNSRIVEFFFKTFYATILGDKGIRWLAQDIVNLPIPRVPLRGDMAHIEEEIAANYHLSAEEVAYIRAVGEGE